MLLLVLLLSSGVIAFNIPSTSNFATRVSLNRHASRLGYMQQQHQLTNLRDFPVQLQAMTGAVEDISSEDEPPSRLRRRRLREMGRNCADRCRKVTSRARGVMTRVLRWQRKNRRSLMLSAALVVGLFFASADHIDHYTSASSSGAFEQNGNPIHRLAPSARTPVESTTFEASPRSIVTSSSSSALGLSRGGALKKAAKGLNTATEETHRTMREAVNDLWAFMEGPKSDTLLLLLATALITPICKRIGVSSILGFLASGMVLGPNGLGWISGIHTTETLAELGIVFFLFEMGIELSVERLLNMKKDVFGLGLSQFGVSAVMIAAVGALCGLPSNAQVVLGGGLALSSSAFVLQLLKDKNQLATRFGKASFGVLLFQDLAVVPLLVVTPILAGGGAGMAKAVGSAIIKASMALGSIALAGRYLLNPLFRLVAQSQSQEAFLGVTLLTVLSMSFMTEGLGLSNTLGAFLAGVLLSETKYRYQIEADISPFRGILLGLFFVTVGFEIDLHLIATNLPLVASIVTGIIATKALVATALALMFGLSLATSQQTGLILSQGGEFAFVAFGLARSLGIFDQATTKLLLTCVSLTMAVTPFLASVGSKMAKKLEEDSDFTHYLGEDSDAKEIKGSDDFVVVVGYGAVGKVVTDLLDRKLVKYVGLEIDPNKAIEARNKGLPVFYGDVGRKEVTEAFNVGKAKAVIVCIAEQQQATRAVIALRRLYPELKIFSRARNQDHASRLQQTLDVVAMVPVLPEDNMLLTLPFGGAVLKSLGYPAEEVNAILEGKRKEILGGRGLQDNEEELALMQLGVDVEAKNEMVQEEGSDQTLVEVLAAAAVGENQEKSPMVANVIEASCPGSTLGVDCDNDDDEDFVGEDLPPLVEVGGGNTTALVIEQED